MARYFKPDMIGRICSGALIAVIMAYALSGHSGHRQRVFYGLL